MRIQRLLDCPHHIHGRVAGLRAQKVHFVQADAVFASTRAAQAQCAGNQPLVQLLSCCALFRVIGVDEVAKVEVSIAHVTQQEVGNS